MDIDGLVERLLTIDEDGAYYVTKNALTTCQEAAAALLRLQSDVEALRETGRFLVARIDDLDWCDWERHANDWNGHVDPALARFRSALTGAE